MSDFSFSSFFFFCLLRLTLSVRQCTGYFIELYLLTKKFSDTVTLESQFTQIGKKKPNIFPLVVSNECDYPTFLVLFAQGSRYSPDRKYLST